jgi:hypothetical protein
VLVEHLQRLDAVSGREDLEPEPESILVPTALSMASSSTRSTTAPVARVGAEAGRASTTAAAASETGR